MTAFLTNLVGPVRGSRRFPSRREIRRRFASGEVQALIDGLAPLSGRCDSDEDPA